MMQRILGNWNDILVVLALTWLLLTFNGILAYPNEKVRLNFEKLKGSKWSPVFQILLPLLIIAFVAKIFFEV